MKRIKRIACLIVLGTLMATFSPNLSADQPEYELPEVTVTCSSGTYGRCFEMRWDLCSTIAIVHYDCKWTGMQDNYCSILLVKICNFFVI